MVQRMLASPFTPLALLGTDRRLAELGAGFGRQRGAVLSGVGGGDGPGGRLSPQPRGARRRAPGARAERRTGGRRRADRRGARGSQRPREHGLDLPQCRGAGRGRGAVRRSVARIRSTAARCGCRWDMCCGCRSRACRPWPDGSGGLLRDRGFRIHDARTPKPATLPEAMAAMPDERVAMLVGAEGPGLSQAAMKASDLRVRIPMSAAPTRSTSPPRPRWRSTSGARGEA